MWVRGEQVGCVATTGHKAKISYDSQAHSRQELGHIEDSGSHKALPQQSDNDVTSEYDHSKYDEWLDQTEYEDSDEDETDQSNLDGLANLLAERDALTSGVNMSYASNTEFHTNYMTHTTNGYSS